MKIVRPLLVDALSAALIRYPDEHQRWIQLSFRLGGYLPNSALIWSIQSMGTLDMLIRCLEDEAQPDLSVSDKDILGMDFQSVLSDAWIGGVYEFVRLLKSRKLISEDGFLKLAHDLELVRITVEKHEIPKDNKLKAPLSLTKRPSNNDKTDSYVYDRQDPKRSQIAPKGISHRGSLMWHVIDHLADEQRWVERRSLSERLLMLEIDQGAQRAS